MYLACEIGQCDDVVLVNVDSFRWEITRVFHGVDGPEFGVPLHYALGSDVTGSNRANMSQLELIVFPRVLDSAGRQQMRGYFGRQIANGYKAKVKFGPGQNMHSIEHPSFTSPIGEAAIKSAK